MTGVIVETVEQFKMLVDESGGVEAFTSQAAQGAEGIQGPPGSSGVPAGGTTGQLLTKTSNADYAAGWSNPAAVTEAGITLADNTTLDFSSMKHGLVPKSTGDTKMLYGNGWGNAPVSGVATVFGRSGAVTAQPGDYPQLGAAPTTPDATADVTVSASNAAKKPLVVQLMANQTANAVEVQSSLGTVLAKINASGGLSAAAEAIAGNSSAANYILNTTGSLYGPGNLVIIATTPSSPDGQGISFASSSLLGWTASSHGWAAFDSALSRISAGVLGVGTGAAGSFAGNLKLTNLTAVGQVNHASYTVATLPSAATGGGEIYVSNEAGGATLAFSDGTNWRRHSDRAIVS